MSVVSAVDDGQLGLKQLFEDGSTRRLQAALHWENKYGEKKEQKSNHHNAQIRLSILMKGIK